MVSVISPSPASYKHPSWPGNMGMGVNKISHSENTDSVLRTGVGGEAGGTGSEEGILRAS